MDDLCEHIEPSTPVVVLQEKLTSAIATDLILTIKDLPAKEEGKCTSAVCLCLTELIGIDVEPEPTPTPDPPPDPSPDPPSVDLTPAVDNIQPSVSPGPAVIGNDPIIKLNGNVYKFSLTPGVKTILLSWTSGSTTSKKGADAAEFIKYELIGVTFKPRTLNVKEDNNGRTNILEDAQWFSQLALVANEKVVLNVTRNVVGSGGFGSMGIQVDGKHKIYDADKWITKFVAHAGRGGDVPLTLGRLKKHVGSKYAQALVVDAPNLRFSIETMPALKFLKEEDKVLFGHLNLRFDGGAMHESSRGLLAQLAGKRALTQHTKDKFKLVRKP